MEITMTSSFVFGRLMRAGAAVAFLGGAGFALSACNTVHGAGKDLSNAGTATGNAVNTAGTATGNAVDSAGNAVSNTANNVQQKM
jgi:predicted small secreted protein